VWIAKKGWIEMPPGKSRAIEIVGLSDVLAPIVAEHVKHLFGTQ
jgi:hypothetical protein